MTATLLSEVVLPHLPSASGLEIMGATAYVLSDDAPFLYLLDAATLAPTGRVPLFETADFATGRIPKATKPDLESMTAVGGPTAEVGLLLLGSGSQPNREVGYYVRGLPPGAQTPLVERLELRQLYAQLRPHLPVGAVLNLEAAAASTTDLVLLQRTVGGGPAQLFTFPLAPALAHLRAPGAPAPAPALGLVHSFELPTLEGYAAGFSGATFVDGVLLVTASVEATTEAVRDGAVLGSFVGVVDVPTQTATFARLGWADGRPYRGKVEGLAVRRPLGPGRLELLLVTDDDLGGSTALVAEVWV